MQRTIRYSHTAAARSTLWAGPARLLIGAKLAQLATDPTSLANQIKRLQGARSLRLRVGDYRIIFTDDGLILEILKVGSRGSIYRD
jgi:mRNA interferase RelE/StbE